MLGAAGWEWAGNLGPHPECVLAAQCCCCQGDEDAKLQIFQFFLKKIGVKNLALDSGRDP